MVSITIPEGFAFVPRRSGVNVAAQLFEAVEKTKADRYTSVRTTSGGYHVEQKVAEAYAAAQPEAEIDVAEPAEDPAGSTAESDSEGGDTSAAPAGTEGGAEGEEEEALAELPVTADSTHADIDAYAEGLDPKVEFPAGINRADKIKLLEEARTTQAKE